MPMTFSHSSVKKFRRCKRQYFYSVVEGLEIRRPRDVIKKGNWYHDILRVHYSGGDWEKEHRRLTKAFNNLLLEEREYYGPDMPDQIERKMRAYLHHWKKEEEEWEILHVEENFEATFTDGDIFSFKPDLVIRDHGAPGSPIWVVDHKTVGSLPDSEWRLEDLQSTLYPWALNELGYEVQGFIFNYIRRKEPTVPSINKDGSISRRRIDTDFYTLATFLKEYFEVDSLNELPKQYKDQLRALKISNSFFRRNRIVKVDALVERQVHEFSITAQEIEVWHQMHEEQDDDMWPRTMLPTCDWDCEFQDLCLVELLGQDGKFMRRSKYQPSSYMKGRGIGKN